MARQNKGLGRGLNSLLGGGSEVAAPAERGRRRVVSTDSSTKFVETRFTEAKPTETESTEKESIRGTDSAEMLKSAEEAEVKFREKPREQKKVEEKQGTTKFSGDSTNQGVREQEVESGSSGSLGSSKSSGRSGNSEDVRGSDGSDGSVSSVDSGNSSSAGIFASSSGAGGFGDADVSDGTGKKKNSDDPNRQGAEHYGSDDRVTIKKVLKRNPDEIPTKMITPNPNQPRTNFDKEELEELAASIERNGILQPILVRQVGKDYQIVAGERRWQAAKKLNLEKMPVRVIDVDDDEALIIGLIENVQRSDLNPIEEAYAYRRLVERQGLTQSEVAQYVSKGRSTVANALRLLELPEAAQQMLFENKISAGHARTILAIPSREGRQKLTDKLLEEKLSVREAETLARLYAGASGSSSGGTGRTPTPLAFKRVARALREALQTNVRVKTVKGKNKIEIEFADEGELEQLFDNLVAFQKEAEVVSASTGAE